MKFGNAQIIPYLFFFMFFAALFFIWAEWMYRHVSLRFAKDIALRKIGPYGREGRRAIKICFMGLAIFLIALALARPQWGFCWNEKSYKGLDILIALDISKSMLAQDVKPDRLSYAKEDIGDFVKNLDGDRVGLIGFAGNAFTYCPLTMDYKGFFLVLDNIKVGSIARGGTSLSSAIAEAMRSFEWALSKQKILIMVGDGESTENDTLTAVKEAKNDKIRIFCVGIGSDQGSVIPYIDNTGKAAFLKDKDGNIVKSKLDEKMLKEITVGTDGFYVKADALSRSPLSLIYEKYLSKLKKREQQELLTKSYKERFQFPAGLALLALIIEIILSMADKK